MSKREWTPPNDEDTVRLLRTMPLPEHLGGGLCRHAAGRIDALRAEVLQYGNTMGRIAIALFGDQNNRTDEDCVRRAERIGLEHAQRGIDLEAALHALDHGLTLHADCAERAERAEAERDALRADAERYRAWRDSHASGMRPFLPERMPATADEHWTHLVYDDGPLTNDAWMRATPEQRGPMIDAAIDAARTEGKR